MQNNGIQSNLKLLKKLRRKAELCRFCHSELKAKYAKCRNRKEFSVVLVSVVSATLIGFYYRGMIASEWVLAFIFILPLVTTILQALDCTVFQWTCKMTQHESSVAIWGDWIREANYLEECILQHSNSLVHEKIQNIQEKYRYCMGNAEQIPSNKFLDYKKRFRAYKLKSEKIDQMSLEEIEKEKNEKR